MTSFNRHRFNFRFKLEHLFVFRVRGWSMDNDLDFAEFVVDDDESDLINMAWICCLVLNWLFGRANMQIRWPLGDRNLLRQLFLRRLLGSDVYCIYMLRMDQEHFFSINVTHFTGKICSRMLNLSWLKTKWQCSYIQLPTMCRTEEKCNFVRSGEITSRYFRQLLVAIGSLRAKYILGPSIFHTQDTI